MAQPLDRRQFLGQTATTGVALGLAANAISARAAESPQNKIVVGVMGLSRGKSLAVGFARQAGCEVKYVCDVDEKRAQAGAASVEQVAEKAPQVITDFRRILDDNDVDVLVNATPNHWHGPGTIMACNAGKHVYVEKPCSHNPHEGELMIEAARKHNRCVQMGAQRRSGDGHQAAMQKLREGVIGRVYLSRSFYRNRRGSIGKGQPATVPAQLDYELWQGPAPRTPYVDNLVHYNWHWRWKWGNGELGNNGVHTLDLSRWGLDVDYPVRVTSSGGRYRYDDDQQTPDTHTVCFEFEGERMATWEGTSCNTYGDGFVLFYGEKGAMTLDSNGNHVVYDERNKEIGNYKAKSRGDAEHFENLLTAIRTDNPSSLNAEIEIGHKSTLLCHLGNIAQRTGRTLNCSPKNGHILDDDEAAKQWKRDYEPGWEPKVS